jgi:hypothetical protein
MIQTELDLYKVTIKNMLCQSAANITQWREKFMIEVLYLYLLIPGRMNFLQFGRYSRFGEQRFRQQFSRFFDWFGFNKRLAQSHTGSRVAIAFDPSYLTKSGKSTPYLGKFWSGCASAVKRGLEISGFGLIDIDLKTCFHLEAVQTPPTNILSQVCQTLIDWYLYIFRERSVKLLQLSRYIVADAYFSKKNFVDGVVSMGFHLISRLRDDAALMYITERQPSGKRGRPRKYDGKIQLEKPDESRFKIFSLEPGQGSLLYAIVYSKALARNIGLCIWKSEDGKTQKLFF